VYGIAFAARTAATPQHFFHSCACSEKQRANIVSETKIARGSDKQDPFSMDWDELNAPPSSLKKPLADLGNKSSSKRCYKRQSSSGMAAAQWAGKIMLRIAAAFAWRAGLSVNMRFTVYAILGARITFGYCLAWMCACGY
jgi:hypothetical protein